MRHKILACFIFVNVYSFLTVQVTAQWSGKYGNEWISYEKKYVKINVVEEGLFKVLLSQLPADFSKNPSTLQMWHKGREVSILHADNQEIWFYAQLNDGLSDSLMFRPSSARMNPYQSFFSDKGVYFLTHSQTPKRAAEIEKVAVTGQAAQYHLHTEVVSLRDMFSFATLNNTPAILNNSYYENVNSWTGAMIYGDSAVGHSTTNVNSYNTYSFKNYQAGTGISPKLNIMLNGLHYGKHEVQILAGKSKAASDLSELSKIDFTGLGGVKREGLVLNDAQFSMEGGGVIALRSKTSDIYDWFSLTYFTLTYPQKIKMLAGQTSYFNFPQASSNFTRINIETVPIKPIVLDISDPFEPKFLQGVQSGVNLELMVPRNNRASLRLLASSEELITTLTPDKISTVDFTPLYASPASGVGAGSSVSSAAYDYLIITSDTLKYGAVEYGKYRSSSEGGGFKTIVYDVRNLYNQFNYGEPSPVAIKRFVEFMLKSGIREEHNLLLVGLGISAPDAAGLRLKKDLPQDVPTFGDPGSDVLLVSGLHGLGQDIPAIPVGRISAFNQQQVLDYLNKVKEFEANKSDRRWQKNVLHLNGGKTSAEITQLSSILKNLNPIVEDDAFGGDVKAFVKQTTAETELVDISKEVNEGVGVISYFGHGSTSTTDLDMGKASDVSRHYNNQGKYPFMYFNGCGVGNVYSGRSVLSLSTDWLLMPNVGAIAVLSNSYNSYVSPTSKQLKILYEELFVKSSSADVPIGKVIQNVAKRILADSPNIYDISNIHQSNLQGDPAIRLFSFSSPDYTYDSNKPLIITGESKKTIGTSSKLQAGVILANYGKYNKDQKIPLRVVYVYKNGSTSIINENISSFPSKDTIFFTMPLESKNIVRIEVDIDPLNTFVELNKSNNSTGLNIEWEVANKLQLYPEGALIDRVAPILAVTFNGRNIVNEEYLAPSPVIGLRLTDDNSLDQDLDLLELYIKPCWGDDCEYKRIDINSSELTYISDRVILLKHLLKDLNEGSYEILVTGKDRTGNNTPIAYNIRFVIGEISRVNLIVSPNPSTEYIRFDLSTYAEVENLKCTIYNVLGEVVQTSELPKVYGGKQSWYWLRNGKPSGMYFYKVEIFEKGKESVVLKGKVVLQ